MDPKEDPGQVLQYIQRVNTQLADELRKLREGTCQKLYKQTRSFIDALQRSPSGQNTTYGPSICTITQVRDCYEHSKQLDGERPTHFTHVLDLFISSVETLQKLCNEMQDCIGETIANMTRHDRQRPTAQKITKELRFCQDYLNEDRDFTDLHHNKTIEKFRGLNTGEVANWGAVLNLIPVIVSKCQEISDATAEWTTVTLAEKHNIFCQPKQTNSARNSAQRSGRSSAKSMTGGQGQKTVASAQVQTKKPRKTYADRVDERNKGRISLLERPPWKPSSTQPHNLYPQLPMHLGDPTQHV